ncbi:MAG: hypothetical protein E6K66_03065 [Nitrospirae bacterium]|nr:MAG: hypothetical protein E6K66_03065 [Nitrospirota bacterium]
MRVSCPSDCVYLESGGDYQQKRLAEQFMPVRRDFYRELAELGGEKAVALFNLVEVVIFSYFQGRRDGQDAEVVAALQALRRTLSPLHVPAAPMPVFAEHLKKEYDTFKKQNPQQIADMSSAPEILDRAIACVSRFSGTGFQSQRFLGGLIGYVRAYHPEIAEHLTKQREPDHIILPGQQFLPPPAPERHTHGPDCHHH